MKYHAKRTKSFGWLDCININVSHLDSDAAVSPMVQSKIT